MHVGITDQHVEGEQSDELGGPRIACFGAQKGGDIATVCTFVLVFRLNVENLREVFDVDRGAIGETIEAFQACLRNEPLGSLDAALNALSSSCNRCPVA
ncbi:hypothetical protein [Rhizobium giardinii]|uniref:Uncharacterized protein n=1 Tax=Rhizobium giardinii TaxID=56731 RepID=A0A7W8XA31_9HYPH|nr:hypothetical protein [Rhizobium giardinii]MBB5536238.1 hypothetical protein [Rhizobium giardinii]